jgi:heterodisulfide reductase subunit C
MDLSLSERVEDLLRPYALWKCAQCGQCSSVCPSCQNGGIKIGEIMSRLSSGSLSLDDETLWQCAMCLSCTERCPYGMSPAEALTVLRNLAAQEGHLPASYREEAQRYLSTGRSFPKTGLTRKIRREMELPELEEDEKAVWEIKSLARGTRLGRIPIEE